MAGTRRRSRISDAAASHRELPSPSPARDAAAAAAAVAENSSLAGDDAGAAALDVAARAQGGHPHSQSQSQSRSRSRTQTQAPDSRSTTGHCRRCSGVVGDFYNAWTKITSTYYLPAMTGSHSSRLRAHGRQKAATIGTDLDGCLIQPLACPNCPEILGFNAVDVPAKKQSFRGRDFFKLSRIELRCEIAPDKVTVVEPHIEVAPEPLSDSVRPSPVPNPAVPPPGPPPLPPPPPVDEMEVDTRPAHVPAPSSASLHRHELHREYHHQPLQQVEANRQSLPPLRSPPAPHVTHGPPQKSPSNPLPSPSPAVKPVHDAPFAQPQSRESTAGLTNRSRELPPVASHPQSPVEQHRINGQYNARTPSEVTLDAIERLQTQISQNSGALSVQTRDMQALRDGALQKEESIRRDFQAQLHQQSTEIRRVDEAVSRLHSEMRGMRDAFTALHQELAAVQASRPPAPAATGVGSAQDSALELMAHQVANISHKASEIDTLKITIEIMKNKIARLEDAATPSVAAAAPPPQPPSRSYQSPGEPSTHSQQPTHAVQSYHSTPPTVPTTSTPVHPAHKPASFQSHSSHSAATPEAPQRGETAQAQGGWVTVNANAKRPHANGVDTPQDPLGQPVDSPKRPKLATIEPQPRGSYASSQGHPQHVYDHMDTDDSESRLQTHSHTLPSQHPRDSIGDSSHAHSSIASHHGQQSAYPVYSTQEAPSEDSWRPESQRFVDQRTTRGRGRGSGGPGSRGGRGRKNLPSQIHLGTPEWEREDWQGAPESQTSPDGYYSHTRSSRGILRRGSGGSTRGRPPSSSGRSVSLGMQGVTTGIGLPMDPYAHTKKTRTKPIRNADGILIRKDGRPDMRSQSSAANLRKVHARKEESKDGERGFTPTSSLQHTMSAGPETPSPTHVQPSGGDETSSVQKKHNNIMGKMFPGGVDEGRKDQDLARIAFEEEQGHTAEPRGHVNHQHHFHQQHHGEGRSRHIKRERREERATESPDDGDVDMDRAEQADDEGQTPSDRSDHSAQYHDAPAHEQQHSRPASKGNPVQTEAQSTADTSQTIAASAESTAQAA